jgi:hypothetical protein
MTPERATELIEGELLAPLRQAIAVAARYIAEGEHAAARGTLASIGLTATARNRVLLGDTPGADAMVEAAIAVRYLQDKGASLLLRKAGLRVDEAGDLMPISAKERSDEPDTA